jgi:sn1-specific diacylglycerol lipase
LFFTIIIKPFQICRSQSVFGDGLLYKKTAAFLAGSNTSIGNLHYASWDDNVNQTPFSIVTDKETQSIVVSIRGSISFNDFITDAALTDSYLRNIIESMGLGKDQSRTRVASPNGEAGKRTMPQMTDNQGQTFRVHGGMFVAAMIMLGFVQRVVADLRRNPTYSKYRLVITGHSLGAGVASLLTLMLRFIFIILSQINLIQISLGNPSRTFAVTLSLHQVA